MKVAVIPLDSIQLGPQWVPPMFVFVPESIPKKYLFPDSRVDTEVGCWPTSQIEPGPETQELSEPLL